MSKKVPKFPVTLSYDKEMYSALKSASRHICKTQHITNEAMTFDDTQNKIIIHEEIHEDFLISMGYHAHRIMNNL